MNLIVKLLPEAHILLDVQAGSKKRVFEQLGILFENSLGIAQSSVFESLFARERLGSTGLGQGIAIPHGRIKGLARGRGSRTVSNPSAAPSPRTSRSDPAPAQRSPLRATPFAFFSAHTRGQ